MAENIPLLNESMNGARLAGVVDYLRHQKRDVYYGFVGPAREEGQPTNKANQAYFTQRDWLGGETLQRGAEVAFTLSYKDGKPQANDITPVEQVTTCVCLSSLASRRWRLLERRRWAVFFSISRPFGPI